MTAVPVWEDPVVLEEAAAIFRRARARRLAAEAVQSDVRPTADDRRAS